jgi:hypothetical protein
MGWAIAGLAAIFTAWFFANMWVFYRSVRLYDEHRVPMVPPRLGFYPPWWRWKYFTRAFVLRRAVLIAVHFGITAFCLWLASLVI